MTSSTLIVGRKRADTLTQNLLGQYRNSINRQQYTEANKLASLHPEILSLDSVIADVALHELRDISYERFEDPDSYIMELESKDSEEAKKSVDKYEIAVAVSEIKDRFAKFGLVDFGDRRKFTVEEQVLEDYQAALTKGDNYHAQVIYELWPHVREWADVHYLTNDEIHDANRTRSKKSYKYSATDYAEAREEIRTRFARLGLVNLRKKS
ncbi:hypothetical protein J4455_01425 [Candidatus Woesearchaeota archaeon]|nr:hypothetical protein [Candidatus Woesearchaeota archaeon]